MRFHFGFLSILAAGCGGAEEDPVSGTESEAESGLNAECTPAALDLNGTFGVQTTVHVLVESTLGVEILPTTSSILLRAELTQNDRQVGLTGQICDLQLPPLQLENNKNPVTFEPHPDLLASIDPVVSTATLGADETCTSWTSDRITAVAGAHMESITAPLPQACCEGAPLCGEAGCANLACDEEADGYCGATVLADTEAIGIPLDEVFVVLRTSFGLVGEVESSERISGEIVTFAEARLFEQSILDCRTPDGQLCSEQAGYLQGVQAINPIISQDPEVPSTFLALRIDPSVDCAALRDMQEIFR